MLMPIKVAGHDLAVPWASEAISAHTRPLADRRRKGTPHQRDYGCAV